MINRTIDLLPLKKKEESEYLRKCNARHDLNVFSTKLHVSSLLIQRARFCVR